jgi:hypothetical protein
LEEASHRYVKTNWDVVVDNGRGRIGIGIVVWEHDGVALATRSTTKNIWVDLIVTEALTALCVIDFMCSYVDSLQL